MNKLKVTIAGLLVVCLGVGVINAQDKTATAPATKQAPAKTSSSKSTTTKATTGSKAAATGTTAKPAQHLKKDGTPDMRYKENKTAKPGTTPTPPTKKGTTTPKKGAPQKAATGGSTGK